MCGIYGVLNLRDRSDPSLELIQQMGQILTHRGPDDDGHFLDRGVALGMRRLSIIDIAGGHQPITNETGTVWMVMNGEIYNFRELRARLEKRGHHFRTQSDTEVVVHLYEEEDVAFCNRLRGMFALALWDSKRSRLVLARDRLGKKPLHVLREPHRLVFASEIKAILLAEGAPRRLSVPALAEYLDRKSVV